MNTPEFPILPLAFQEEDNLWQPPPTPLTPINLAYPRFSTLDEQPGIDPRAITNSPFADQRYQPQPFYFGSSTLDTHPPAFSSSFPLAPAAHINDFSPPAFTSYHSGSDGLDVEVLLEDVELPELISGKDDSQSSDSVDDDDDDCDDYVPTADDSSTLITSSFSHLPCAVDQPIIDPALVPEDPPVSPVQVPKVVHPPMRRANYTQLTNDSEMRKRRIMPKKSSKIARTSDKAVDPVKKEGLVKRDTGDKKVGRAKQADIVSKVKETKPRSARLDLLARQKQGSKKTRSVPTEKQPLISTRSQAPRVSTSGKKPLKKADGAAQPDDEISTFVSRRKIPAFPARAATPLRPTVSGKGPRKTIAIPAVPRMKPSMASQVCSAPPSPSPSADSHEGSDYAPSPSPPPLSKASKGKKRPHESEDEDSSDKPFSKGTNGNSSKGGAATASRRSRKQFGTGRRDQNQRAQAKYRNKVKDRGVLTTRFLGRVFQLCGTSNIASSALRRGIDDIKEAYLRELGELDPIFTSNFVDEFLRD
ncbi:hypothetical protein I316_00249 [Kwoniella heveanensis BCC8398]|uniref:Uncharacterized protein n=1 Tax=Kwoniella heveanensis BCC8398 TaxID=1296120 RepID=A0A1B9H428_9TREE|nr:hypothetical protein I316_00249 [Kwoniella heveanensis BCC8398]